IYNASKFAVVGMSEAFRQDLAGQNIGVSVLCPGFVNTGIYTSERNRPADLGGSKASAFDLSRDASRSPEDIEALKASLENMLDPALVGDMVLQAIIDNDLYILTHPEFRESVLEKTRLLNETFDRWSAFRDSHAR
ncbi:MAG: SDR family NAD(P)-dependent oxidoreductase, partial [Proteobacteria bacterium]|nr:SDR family NAD(P)-dependent oxidoreductase [Pseudomonadota bacterium]